MVNKKHKDRLFSYLFGREENKQWTLELYNAINDSHYTDSDHIKITTIEDVLYMGMKNDLSFILHQMLSIYEHQASWNPNLPVRELMYLGKLYDRYIHENKLNIYGSKLIQLPVPKLVVFYNGTDDKEEDMVLQLKDSFPENLRDGISDVSVKVRMLNINKGKNKKIMDACKPLAEYAWLIDEIRRNKDKGMDIETAVDLAIDAMPAEYSIRDFLIRNKAEVRNMCITEYNEEETMQMIREESREEGREEGRQQGEENGENKMGKLIDILLSLGRTADLQKVATDRNVRHSLYKEFNIL